VFEGLLDESATRGVNRIYCSNIGELAVGG
jgi:hypothetical protein